MPLPIETTRLNELKKLASTRFGVITPAEESVLELSVATEEQYPSLSKDRPEVRAAFLRWLITDHDAAPYIDPLGLRVTSATVQPALDLDFCKTPFRIRFRHTVFSEGITLRAAEVPALDLYRCASDPGISADGLRIKGRLSLRRCNFSGQLRLLGVQIDDDFDCTGTTLTGDVIALAADGAKIGGDVVLAAVKSEGEVRLIGAQIGGDLNCIGTQLTATGDALSVDRVEINGTVFLRGRFSCAGTIRFHGAHVRGSIDCTGAQFRFLVCEDVKIEGNLFWNAIRNPQETHLNLLRASIKTLLDDTASWPAQNNLVIKGLEYKELAQHDPSTEDHLKDNVAASSNKLDARERIRWLSLQDDVNRLDPQPWIWLAQLLKDKDDIVGSRRVVCEYRSMKARASGNRISQWIEIRLAHLERNPWGILRLFLPLLGIGSLVFWLAALQGKMPPTDKEARNAWVKGDPYPAAYPRFNPVIYTLENELPLVKFGLDDKWGPDPNLVKNGNPAAYWALAGFRWFLILAGWVQGIMLSVGINRRFQS
jgi:hypothetical protein